MTDMKSMIADVTMFQHHVSDIQLCTLMDLVWRNHRTSNLQSAASPSPTLFYFCWQTQIGEVERRELIRFGKQQLAPKRRFVQRWQVDSPSPNWTSTIEQNNWTKCQLNKNQLNKKSVEQKSIEQKVNWASGYLNKYLIDQIPTGQMHLNKITGTIEQMLNWTNCHSRAIHRLRLAECVVARSAMKPGGFGGLAPHSIWSNSNPW